MKDKPQILCIGSVLWDIIGRAPSHMVAGADVPGRITRLPGGVAMNIAMALNGYGLNVALLSALGRDAEGRDLLQSAQRMGLNTNFIYLSDDLPTDRYMAIEGANGLIAAIADAHSLEAAGSRILTALYDGRLASAAAPWRGLVVLDGNLSLEMLETIARDTLFDLADLRLAPASPGKAERLNAFLGHQGAVLYLNLEEANLLTRRKNTDTKAAALALLDRGMKRVLVTHGGQAACEASADGFCQSLIPPPVMVTRVTGAGDMFMAAHISAELRGEPRDVALAAALDGAATYISGETPL